MGGAESLGGLHVDIETPNVPANGEVTGTIHLLVKEPTHADGLEIHFKGKEFTYWATKEGKLDVKHTGSRKLIHEQTLLHSFANGEVPAGQYNFPFTVVVPQDLPSTFRYEEPELRVVEGAVIAKISYKLVAKVTGENTRIDKGRADLNLSRPLSFVVVPMSQEKAARISTWCGVSKGVIKVKVDTDKNLYHPGEAINVSVNVDNRESQLPGIGYQVSLVRTILMRCDFPRVKTITSVVSSQTIHEPFASGQAASSDCLKALQMTIPSDDTLKFLSTATGHLIQCHYCVKAEILMDGSCMCCGDLAAAEKEVIIYPADLQKKPLPVLAEMWKPILMPKLRAILRAAEHTQSSAQNS